MVALGTGSFDNDYALAWLAEVDETDVPDLVRAALDVTGADNLPAADGARALAAAEIVAAALGQPAADLPEPAKSWVTVHSRPFVHHDALAAMAAVERVRSPASELYSKWAEAGAETERQVQSSLDDLLRRLRATE